MSPLPAPRRTIRPTPWMVLAALLLVVLPARPGSGVVTDDAPVVTGRVPGSHPGCLPRALSVPTAPPRLVAELTPGSAPEEEAAYVGSIDSLDYARTVAELCGEREFDLGGATRRIHTRFAPETTAPDGIGLARDYITDRFESAGYAVVHQEFSASHLGTPFDASNVVAVHPGTLLAEEILVVGAHYDATALSSGQGLPAPGAEDNASGTAAVLLLAERLAGFQSDRTIHFVCFGAEEQGLYGSEEYVRRAVQDGLTVVGALTMDMISAWVTDYGVLIEGELPWQPLMFALRDNVQQWTSLTHQLSYNSFGSDHVPFQEADIPALLAIELDWDEYDDYHRTTDTFDKLDPGLGHEITRALAGTIADIASIRRGVRIGDPPPGAGPVPGRLALLANRPNPFNPRTVVHFSIPDAGPTRLEIVDLRGRRVRVLLDERLEAGPHEIPWDGLDETGAPVASGLYFSRLSHEDGVRTRGLTLLR